MVDLRPDIAAARSDMAGGGFGSHRAIRKLADSLAPEETVRRIIMGVCDGRNGILALTDSRLIFLADQLGMKKDSRDFPLDRIQSINIQSGFKVRLGTAILISAAGVDAEIKTQLKGAATAMVNDARAAITAPRTAAAPDAAPAPAGWGIPEQIRKLADLRDAGLVSAEEFEAKRAELLARM